MVLHSDAVNANVIEYNETAHIGIGGRTLGIGLSSEEYDALLDGLRALAAANSKGHFRYASDLVEEFEERFLYEDGDSVVVPFTDRERHIHEQAARILKSVGREDVASTISKRLAYAGDLREEFDVTEPTYTPYF